VTLPEVRLDTLELRPWLDDELRLLVPKDWKLARRRTFQWQELDGVPFVGFEAGSAVRGLIDGRLRDAGVAVDVVMELRSIESIKQMVAAGIGAAFVSRYALGAKDRALDARDGNPSRQLALVTRSDRTLSPATTTFLSLLQVPA
jgi:DNA-binding transcriptional LysR family regulator